MRAGKISISAILLLAGVALGLLLGGNRQPLEASGRTDGDKNPTAPETSGDGGPDHAVHASDPDWCNEHWFPESECTKCNPALIEEFKNRGDWCGEHGFPESHCRKCNPRLSFPQEPRQSQVQSADESKPFSVYFPPNDRECASEQALIQFASAETPTRFGLKVEPALTAEAYGDVEAPAELIFDETMMAAVTTSLPATVIRWRVEPGTVIEEGQILAELESPEMAQLAADYLEAYAAWNLADVHLKRAGDLVQRNLISQAEYQDAEAQSRMSQSKMDGVAGKLRSAGLYDADISALKSDHRISPQWFLRASKAGTLLERRAPLGELLAAGSTLALIGQPASLWIEAHVRERDLSRFRAGMEVDFMEDGGEFLRAGGKIIWVAQYLDSETRTGLVRAKVTSPPSALKAHMFGRLRLAKTASESAVLVSKDAVQWEGCCHIVFVQESSDRYRPRKVSIDRGDNRHYTVTSGLESGELVVTDGSFLLKSELKKESLGAGCAGE